MARATGTIIGARYEILGYLGSGTYGEVYRARDHHLDTVIALKLLKIAGGNVWAEAQSLMNLRSHYILPVLNADIYAGVPFLVTELAMNGSADQRMPPAGVAPMTAVRWVRHACRGAARAHGARLLHRDIKPHNLFLTGEGEAQLGDFGIAAFMDANGEASPIGTPITRAPEVTAGGNTSIRSDVYSLGASLYALLSGNYPTTTANAPLRDVAPHVSQALAQRVQKAIAIDPTERYETATALDRALGTLPVASRDWRRTDEHNGHACCYRGTGGGKADVTVCLVPTGTRHEVVAQHQPSGRRISAACRSAAPSSASARHLRAGIRAAS